MPFLRALQDMEEAAGLAASAPTVDTAETGTFECVEREEGGVVQELSRLSPLSRRTNRADITQLKAPVCSGCESVYE